jgi:hypothetical protein
MQNNKIRIALLFPDGVGIKNYLYSDAFDNKDFELLLLHNFDSETILEVKKHTKLVKDIRIPDYKESVKEKFFRELICYSRLHYNSKKVKNSSILYNWKKNHKGVFKKFFYLLVSFFAPFFAKKYKYILFLERLYQKQIRKNKFYNESKKILVDSNTKILFCSHQRGLKAATIFAAANDLGIKTTTVIYSWDNLPKARLALRSDRYFVWSEYMKDEMKLYYPEISQNKVIVTGSPQFEYYLNSNNIIEKETFFNTYDLDLNKKIICFSGDDVKTSPDDPQYLYDIAMAIEKANLQSEYQILFRRCPVDISDRFNGVLKQFPNLIKVAAPIWFFKNNKEWSTVYPSIDDVKLLVSTAFYSDVVINVGSTMAFDFSMFDKPCIFINYDQLTKNNNKWSVKTIYEFQHFRSMNNRNAVIWLNSKDEIISKLTKPNFNATAINNWKNIVLGDFTNASENIQTQLLKKI